LSIVINAIYYFFSLSILKHFICNVLTTGQLGEPVTFICLCSDGKYSNTRVKWYKQSFGDTLTLITTLMKTTTDPAFEQGFSSRFAANFATEKSTLTILKTVKEDEALYHCAFSTWKTDQWIGTYLSLKGNTSHTVTEKRILGFSSDNVNNYKNQTKQKTQLHNVTPNKTQENQMESKTIHN
uniref:Ig-like domain-containing protein n=1 Tax=Kryptolebias marmoratus TaxID=37003 RepID=A0A3Q3FQD6_KRYMA